MEDVTLQYVFNGVVAALVIVVGWLRKADKAALEDIKDDLKDLDEKESKMNQTLNSLAVEIAKHYVSKKDLERFEDHVTSKIDKVDDKVDSLHSKFDQVIERRSIPRIEQKTREE